jgi:predicted nucleotidyltransferase
MTKISSTTLKKITECYEEYLGEDLISLVLFGSHARGEAKKTSDLDLFLVAKGLPAKPFKRVLYVRAPLKGQFKEKICLIAKTPDEIRSAFPSLFLDVFSDGISLFDKEGFFEMLKTRVGEIIVEAGLERKKDSGEYYWEWKTPPRKGWEITWNGYREL